MMMVMMMMMIKSLRVTTLKTFEGSRMSRGCGLWLK
jgi:hypothetical protein